MRSSSHVPDLVDRLAHGLVAPLDDVRSALLRALGGWVRPFVVDPVRRIQWLGSIGLAIAFGLAVAQPGLLLALGPIVLGVPHLVADVRYLVLRPGLHRRAFFSSLVLLPCALAFVRPMLEVVAIALLGAALAARGAWWRRGGLVALAAGVAIVGGATDRRGEIVFAHLHNAIAFAWLLLGFARSQGESKRLLVPLALAAGLAVVIAMGLVPTSASGDPTSLARFGLAPWMLRSSLSPVEDPVLADRFVALFAFGQAAHYAVWLRFVPELARGRKAPRSFRSSLDALRLDLGTPFFVVALALALLFPALAFSDLAFARDAYLRLALFHGPLELAALGIYFAEEGRGWTR